MTIFMYQKENPSTVNQLLSQIQELQDRVNSLSEEKNSMILRQRPAFECPTFPANPREYRVPEECFAAILVYRTRHGIRRVSQETFLKIHMLQKSHSHHSSSSQGT